jgi:peroxiredoxin Q/BCP
MKSVLPFRTRSLAIWVTPMVLSLLAARPAAPQSESKSPAPSPPQAPITSTAVSPHPGMVIIGQVAVGQPAPDFELDGSLGRPVRLSSLRGEWVLLVFADRKDSIAALEPMEPGLRQHAIHLVGVCNEKAHGIETFAARRSLTILLLADVSGEVSATYGLWERVNASTIPGFVLIDPHGVVKVAVLGRALPVDRLTELVMQESGNS